MMPAFFLAVPGLKLNPKLTSRFMKILTYRAGQRLMKTTDELLCARQRSAMISLKKGREFYDAMFFLGMVHPD